MQLCMHVRECPQLSVFLFLQIQVHGTQRAYNHTDDNNKKIKKKTKMPRYWFKVKILFFCASKILFINIYLCILAHSVKL